MVNKNEALFADARDGKLEDVEVHLLAEDIAVEHTNVQGMTPLIAAAARGHAAVLKPLRKAGAELEATEMSGWTALMHAAAHGNAECVKLLLFWGVDVHVASSRDGNTALHLAAARGSLECVRLLAGAGADVTKQNDRHGNTALELSRKPEVAEFLGSTSEVAKAVAEFEDIYGGAPG